MTDLVISADNMDDETFAKHMTHRHADSLGGLEELTFRSETDIMAGLWRSFHRRLHAVRVGLPHEHAAYRPAEDRAEPGRRPASRIKATS
jgi:hypothetical protein